MQLITDEFMQRKDKPKKKLSLLAAQIQVESFCRPHILEQLIDGALVPLNHFIV